MSIPAIITHSWWILPANQREVDIFFLVAILAFDHQLELPCRLLGVCQGNGSRRQLFYRCPSGRVVYTSTVDRPYTRRKLLAPLTACQQVVSVSNAAVGGSQTRYGSDLERHVEMGI